MTSYEELSEDMRKQIDATVWLINAHVTHLNEAQTAYVREHIANTVVTCLGIQTREEKKKAKEGR